MRIDRVSFLQKLNLFTIKYFCTRALLVIVYCTFEISKYVCTSCISQGKGDTLWRATSYYSFLLSGNGLIALVWNLISYL